MGTSRLTRCGASVRMSSSSGCNFPDSVRVPACVVTGRVPDSVGRGGTLALPPNRPGGSSRRATSATACRHAMPRSSAPSAPSVSLRPASFLARRSQSQAIARGERSLLARRRTARRFLALIRSPHRRSSTRRELEQAADVPEVDPSPGRQRRAGLAHEPLQRVPLRRVAAAPRIRASVAEGGAPMLDVVIERAVDVGDPAARQRDHGQPVVVVGRAVAWRERQRQLEQLAAEQRSGAGDGVRNQERRQVGVVVATPRPVRVGEQLVRRDRRSERRCRRGWRHRGRPAASRASRGASDRPGRRASRTRRSVGSSRARARSCGSSRGGEATARRQSAGRRRGCVASWRTAPARSNRRSPRRSSWRGSASESTPPVAGRGRAAGRRWPCRWRPRARGHDRSPPRWRPRLVPGRARSAPARPSRACRPRGCATAPSSLLTGSSIGSKGAITQNPLR